MQVERTKKEVIIRLSANVDAEDLQDFLNYARYKELTVAYSTPQEKVDQLSSQINKDWWKKNRKKLLNGKL